MNLLLRSHAFLKNPHFWLGTSSKPDMNPPADAQLTPLPASQCRPAASVMYVPQPRMFQRATKCLNLTKWSSGFVVWGVKN